MLHPIAETRCTWHTMKNGLLAVVATIALVGSPDVRNAANCAEEPRRTVQATKTGDSAFSSSNNENPAGGAVLGIILLIAIIWMCSASDSAYQKEVKEQNTEAEQARKWAMQFVREKFARCAPLVESHYTSSDLEADLKRDILAATTAATIREHAKALVGKIDHFRAYEAVRAAYRAEVEILGAHFPYDAIEKDVEALRDPKSHVTDVRGAELELLARIKRLARYYRPDAQEKPARSLAQVASSIEFQVRSEARPEDTEEDIQREIAHRRARLYDGQHEAT